MIQKLLKIGAILTTLLSVTAQAAIPQHMSYLPDQLLTTAASHQGLVLQHVMGHQELNLGYIGRLSEMVRTELRLTAATYVPTYLTASTNSNDVAKELISRSLGRFIETSEWGKTHVGEKLKALEEPLNQKMSITDDRGTKHQIGFNIQAARSIASVDYSGIVDATLSYSVSRQTAAFEVAKPINANSRFVISHTTHSSETRDIVGFRVEW